MVWETNARMTFSYLVWSMISIFCWKLGRGLMLTLTFMILKFYKNAGKNREGQNGSAVVLLYYTNQNYIKEYRYELQDMSTSKNRIWLKGILSTSCVIFPYPKLLSISVLTFIKWRVNTELLMNTLRNVVFSTKNADHRYRKLINYALTWARPTLFIYLYLC